MSNARHARLARRLIRASGGAPKAAAHCRLEKTRLYEFGDEYAGVYMPADVIADLEELVGEPIYSRALFENRPARVDAKALLTEVSATTELSANLQRTARLATEDGTIDAAERRQLDDGLEELDEQLRATRAALDRVRP